MKNLLIYFLTLAGFNGFAQVVTTDPVLPRADQPVTIQVDVTGTDIDNYNWNNITSPIWLWAWIAEGCASDCDAPTNVNPATSPAQDAAKATRISTDPDIYEITITPTAFFGKPASELEKIGIILKATDWAGGQTGDMFIEFAGEFSVKFTSPSQFPIFKNTDDEILVTANASEISDLTLTIDGGEVETADDATSISYTHTISEPPGSYVVTVSADNGTETIEKSFTYIVRAPTVEEVRPEGIIDGINYHADQTKVTLGLWAPGKSSVYVPGDFNDWSVSPEYQMKKDGEHFWIEITGLTPGEEYAFQYLIDESIYVADPYADKILDPDDQYIPASSYPDLKSFPQEALREQWYFNRVSVLQTGQTPFAWQVTDFEKPPKEKLVIYELLIRDFFASDQRTYQNLIDTIGYFKRLGVNAIELMPIMEFNGNESWGYNPTFMFAPDKYYGHKNVLREFIDKCHQEGIAVILDITMNHQDIPNSYAMMDFNFTSFKPTVNNKWFNTDARHPFNVFNDMNHESDYTQAYLDTVNHYWLHEYKVDGFRFDLSKGFTQTNSGGDVGAWSSRDESRIALLKRMADRIWSHTPDAYIILEHFADNSEEKELTEYRAGEGKGMMVWGNLNHAYNQNTMGYNADSDVSWVYHGSRGWSAPHVVGYMESHDEERLMYRNIQFGRTSGSYNIKNIGTGLERVEAATTFFYTVPGPKMLWQFGEFGYDQSINRCENGSINNDCRISPKPVKWEYLADENRKSLFDHTAELIHLRNSYDVFTSGEATFHGGSNFLKQITLKNTPYTPAPSGTGDMNVQVAVNFDVTEKEIALLFPHIGEWYNYYDNGRMINVDEVPFTISLAAGEYKLFTDYPIKEVPAPDPTTGIAYRHESRLVCYPVPADTYVAVRAGDRKIKELVLLNLQGMEFHPGRITDNTWSVQSLAPGLYLAAIHTDKGTYWSKMIKN